jgi:hypothetical protein
MLMMPRSLARPAADGSTLTEPAWGKFAARAPYGRRAVRRAMTIKHSRTSGRHGTAAQQSGKTLHRGTAVRLAHCGARNVAHRWSLLPRAVVSPGARSWLIPRDVDQHAKHAAK